MNWRIQMKQKRFQEASEHTKQAQSFLRAFLDVETQGETGIPKPLEAMIQLLSSRTGGNLDAARDAMEKYVLEPYFAMRVEEASMPEVEQKARQAEREAKIWQKKAQSMAMKAKASEVMGHFARLSKDLGLDPGDDDVQEVDNTLASAVERGENVSEAGVRSLLEKVKATREKVRKVALSTTDAEAILKEHPELARKILEARAKAKNRRGTTEKPTMPRARHRTEERATNGRRRAGSSEPEFINSLSEWEQQAGS